MNYIRISSTYIQKWFKMNDSQIIMSVLTIQDHSQNARDDLSLQV